MRSGLKDKEKDITKPARKEGIANGTYGHKLVRTTQFGTWFRKDLTYVVAEPGTTSTGEGRKVL